MKPIIDVIREKELEMQHVHEEIEALQREKELHIKNIERELETLRAAAKIITETAEHAQTTTVTPVAQPHTVAAAAPIPSAPVESFPVQSVPVSAPEPARKRWP